MLFRVLRLGLSGNAVRTPVTPYQLGGASSSRLFVGSAVGALVLSLSGGCLVDTNFDPVDTGSSTDSNSGNEVDSETTTAGTASNGTQSEAELEPAGVQCGTMKDSVCLQRVPIDWYGPIQPQRSSRFEDLTPCEAPGLQFDSAAAGRVDYGGSKSTQLPDANANIYVDSLKGAEATCTSQCTSELEIGTCAPMTFIMKKYDAATGKCGDMILDAMAPIIENTCEHQDPRWLPSNDIAIGAIPPQPLQGEAICKAAGSVTADVPPPEVGQYYRVCAGEEEYEGQCPAGQICTRFSERDSRNRVAMGCIYKKGDVACPTGAYNAFRVLLYGQAEDERGCSECQVEHKKGELRCDYDIKLAANTPDANCAGGVSTRAEDICLSQKDIAMDANGAAAVQGTYLELNYTGTCSAKASEPEGKIKLKEPVTLCCAGF